MRFRDSFEAWENLPNRRLEGFGYDEISDVSKEAPIDRVKWLKQGDPRSRRRFNGQPYRTMIAALRRSGRTSHAVAVSRALETRRRKSGQVSLMSRPFHWAYGVTAGYGYSLSRAAGFLILGIAVMSIIAMTAYRGGLYVPSSDLVLQSDEWRACQDDAPVLTAQCWRNSKRGSGAETIEFNPAVYAMDTMIPFVDLKQEAEWSLANKRELQLQNGMKISGRHLYWIEVLFIGLGWLLSAFIAAAISKPVRDDN